MSSIQEQGTLPTQQEKESHALHGRNVQVQNNMGGWVYAVDDMMRLQRYVIIGSESGTYHVMKEKLDRQNVQCLDRLVAAGKGVEAVQTLKDISVNGRNVKQNALLYAYALLARCNDKDTKHAAYAVLSEVCRIPTHLFMFIKFCETEGKDSGTGTGWGRAHKRAVAKWYTNFADRPNGAEQLARLVTKYKNRESWTHKDVLRLAHPSCSDPPELAFILRYIAKSLSEAKEMYRPESVENANLQRISRLLGVFEEASNCHNADQLCGLIREYKLSWEHCASELLRKKEVWLALLPNMPITALVRNLGRMTAIGLFAINSEEEEMAVKKLRTFNMNPIEEEALEGDNGEEPKPRRERKRNLIHPFTILISMITYKKGHGEKGKLSWKPNQKVLEALNDAFYLAFQNVEPTNKKYFLAIDVSGSMSQPCLGTTSIECSMAAAAMVMMTVRTESAENVIIKGFSHQLKDLDITKSDKLETVMAKVNRMTMGATDCARPMLNCIENRIKDVDAFAVYTDNETWYGKVHPSEAMRQYRTYANKPDAKLIVFGMCATEFTIADQEDPNMLDVVGFDSAAPRVMAEFVNGKI